MSDRGDEKGRGLAGVSRRRLLYALSAVGTAGALAGVGTAAVMVDRERFRSTDLNAGQLVLDVNVPGSETAVLTFEDVSPGVTQSQTVCFTVDTNPAWAWIQICPTLTSRQNLLLRMLEATVTFDGAWGGSVSRLSGSLFDVLRTDIDGYTLLGGVPLTGVETDLDSDEEVCMTVDLRLSGVVSDTVAEQIAGSTVALALEASATQSRHVEPANPFDPCGGPGTQGDPEGIDISWIAFCVEDDTLAADDVELTVTEEPPKTVRWLSSVPVDAVLVKAGQEQWIFEVGGATQGFAGPESTDGGVLFYYGNDPDVNSDPCFGEGGVKFDWVGGDDPWDPTEYDPATTNSDTTDDTEEPSGGPPEEPPGGGPPARGGK